MWKTRGFTLVEIVISMGVMAVLSAGVITLIGQGSGQSARDTRRRNDLQEIANALDMYRDEEGTYPTSLNDLEDEDYLSDVPVDPRPGREYPYFPQDSAGTGCTALPNDRCVAFVLCAGGEKNPVLDPACSGMDCGSGIVCSISNTSK